MEPEAQLAEDAAAHKSRWLALVQQPSDDLLLGAGQGGMTRLVDENGTKVASRAERPGTFG
jgi:hypothetical protein